MRVFAVWPAPRQQAECAQELGHVGCAAVTRRCADTIGAVAALAADVLLATPPPIGIGRAGGILGVSFAFGRAVFTFVRGGLPRSRSTGALVIQAKQRAAHQNLV